MLRQVFKSLRKKRKERKIEEEGERGERTVRTRNKTNKETSTTPSKIFPNKILKTIFFKAETSKDTPTKE